MRSISRYAPQEFGNFIPVIEAVHVRRLDKVQTDVIKFCGTIEVTQYE